MHRMLRGGSAAVLAAALMGSVATAQDAASEGDVDEVITTGIRQSLENAQNIKRNSDTFVDSITASDIGALPDRSVLEAIQRVPGVSISRFAAGDDPDHQTSPKSSPLPFLVFIQTAGIQQQANLAFLPAGHFLI